MIVVEVLASNKIDFKSEKGNSGYASPLTPQRALQAPNELKEYILAKGVCNHIIPWSEKSREKCEWGSLKRDPKITSFL